MRNLKMEEEMEMTLERLSDSHDGIVSEPSGE